jgi:hypothetical protein
VNEKALCHWCGEAVSPTAKFCLKCGQQLPGPPVRSPARTARKAKRRWWIWAGLPGGAIVLGLAVIVWLAVAGQLEKDEGATDALSVATSPTSIPSASMPAATATSLPTSTPLPTATVQPTATPPPTATPVPTATPITPTPTSLPTSTPTPSLTPTRRPTPVAYCYVGRLERIEDYTYPLISIHGLVVDRSGKGVKGVRVRVSAFNWYHDVRTGWDGLIRH